MERRKQVHLQMHLRRKVPRWLVGLARVSLVICYAFGLWLVPAALPAQAAPLPAHSGMGAPRLLVGPPLPLRDTTRLPFSLLGFNLEALSELANSSALRHPSELAAGCPSAGLTHSPSQSLLRPAALLSPIPQLEVAVNAPAGVSTGDTAGQVYTATVRNGSATRIAYSLYLSATLPATGFSYVLGSSTVVSRTGTIVHNESTGAGAVTWTPTTTFDLGTGETITLTFRLSTACNAVSGQQLRVWTNYEDAPGGNSYAASGEVNITVGSGNLVIEKSPNVQDARYGDVVTWTVKAKNTGLGDLYGVAVTDTIGSGFTDVNLDGLPTAISTMAVGQSQSFTVTARVNSCTNLTDTVQASWNCGNDDGTGTGIDPVLAAADVAFLLEIPSISLSANSLGFSYCHTGPQTAVITMTNGGPGPALNFALDSDLESGIFNVSNVSPGWSYTPASGVFAYTVGAISGSTSVTLTFDLTYAADLCAADSGNVVLASSFTDACGLAFIVGVGPSVSLPWTYGGDAPTVSLSKSGPAVVEVGEQAVYTVSLSADNVQHITPTLIVTDAVPADLVVNGASATTGAVLFAGQTVTWTVDASGSAPISGMLTITTTASGGSSCGAGRIVQNTAAASAPVDCPGCPPVTASASVNTAIRDYTNCQGPLDCLLSLDKNLDGIAEVCTDIAVTNTAVLTDVTASTWASMVFTETLGKGYGGELPGTGLSYVTDSRSVIVNGLDRTNEVTITSTSPQLVLDFSGLVTPTGAVSMTVSYDMRVPQAALDGEVSQQFFDWSVLDCECGAFFEGQYLTISRGDLDVSLAPRSINACEVTTYTLSVTGGTPDRVTDNAVVTFTTEAADFASFHLLGYNSYFGTVNVPAVVSLTDTITWTFPSPITATGEISFAMQRRCSGSGALGAHLAFDDKCGSRFAKSDVFVPPTGTPGISLFVTPDTYEVTEHNARWRIYATNVGNGSALNLVITDVLGAGLQFNHSVVSPASGVVTNTAGGPGDDVTWTVARLDASQQLRIDVYADVVGCSDLTSQVTSWAGCLGDTCDAEGPDGTTFSLAPASVRSSNGQVADLPLCDMGWVMLTTQNSSGAAHIYNLTITETAAYLPYVWGSTIITVTGATGGVITTTTAFQPQVVTGANVMTMTWPYTDTHAVGILDDRGPEESVIFAFRVRTDCASPSLNQVRAAASADGPCGESFTRQESAVTLRTTEPDITINKQGRNLTTGQSFGSLVIAAPGDTVVWRIGVSNDAAAHTAYQVTVTDTLPANMNAAVPSTSATTGTVTPTAGLVMWGIGTLAAGASETLYITGTVDSGECSSDTTNAATLAYYCPHTGCRVDTEAATAALRTAANLSLSKSPGSLNQCGGVITVTMSNSGPTATNVILTDTLPAGLVYSATLPASSPPPDYITATNGISTQPVWGWDALPNGTSTLVFEARSTSAGCFAGGSNQANASYRSQGCTAGHTASGSRSISALTPAISPVSGPYIKTPHSRAVTSSQTVTWTLAWRNSGTGTAYNVVVTDVLASGYTLTGAGHSTGTAGGQTPVTAANAVTWTVGTAPANTTWTAVVTATVNGAPTDLRNDLGVSSDCWGDCGYGVSETAYATANSGFAKSQSVSFATIGDPVVYTITTELFGSYGYTSTLITDTLPQANGTTAISVTSVVTQNNNGANAWLIGPLGGQVITFTTADGSVQGPETITITIAGVVTDDPAVDRGDILTNRADLTYNDQGQPYSFTDSESLTVLEPLLSIGKSVASSSGSTSDLDGRAVLTYTLGLTNSGTSPAYDVAITDSIPSGISVTIVYAGGSLSGDGRTATWSVGSLGATAPANTAVLSYTVVLTPGVPAGVALTNVVSATYTSRAGSDANERSYGPITDTQQVQVADLEATKSVAPTSSSSNNLSIGDVLTYTLRIAAPPGTAGYWPEWRDTLPAGVRFVTGTQALSGSHIADLGVSSGPITSTTGLGDNQREVVIWYLRSLTNTSQTMTAVVTMTFRAQATGVTPGGTVVNLTQTGSLAASNDVRLRWNTTDYGSHNSGDYLEDADSVTSYLGQPHLFVDKDSTPAPGSTVGASEFITYTLLVTNDGHIVAHDVVISDDLAAEVTLTGWSFASGPGAGASVVVSPSLPATGVITFGLSCINGADVAPSGAKQVMLTLTTTVSATVGAGLTITNTADVPYYDSQTGAGPDEGLMPRQRTYDDGQDSVSHNTEGPTGLFKAVSPFTATVSQTVVYTITVPSPTVNAYLHDVFVTDTLDSRLQPNAAAAAGGVGSQVGISGQVVTATFDHIVANAAATIVITATVRDAPSVIDGGIIPDGAQLTWSATGGGAQAGPLTSNTVNTTLAIPALVTTKSASQPAVTESDRFSYTYVVTNTGGGLAQNVNLSDTLPGPNFQYVTGSTSIAWPGGSSAADPGIAGEELTWLPNAALLGGEVLTMTFAVDVSVPPPLGQDQVYTNTAAASGQDALGNPIPADNSSHVPGDSDPDDQDTAAVNGAYGEVGDFVWYDWDAEGDQDESPLNGIAGVAITLTYDSQLLITTTNASGYYSFTQLPLNQAYTVTVGPVDGYTNTTPSVLNPTLTYASRTDYTLDFGFDAPGQIGDYVWFDQNGDQVQDPWEAPVAGAVITLTYASQVVTMTTDANGIYLFDNIPVNQGAYTTTIDTSSLPPNSSLTTPGSFTSTLTYASPTDLSHDYGMMGPGQVGDLVWYDYDGEGDQDELPLLGVPGVVMTLTFDSASITTTTDANGIYTFTDLLLETYTYTVTVGTVPNLTPTTPTEQSTTLTQANPTDESLDFGLQPPPAGLGIVKMLIEPPDGIASISDTITFTVRVTNTGQTTITSLTITDTYDAEYLTLTSWSATPDEQTAGFITWTNALAGFLPLAPQASFTLTVDFHGEALTISTTNTAAVAGQDEYGQSVGPEQDSDSVSLAQLATVDPGTTVYFVQIWTNDSNRVDRDNITVYDIPSGWQVRVWRDPSQTNVPGVYTTAPFTGTWVWVATDSTGDGTLDDNDTVNPAADTAGDGIPDTGAVSAFGGSINVILEVTPLPNSAPATYILRERGSSHNDWVTNYPTLPYNDDQVLHHEALKIVEINPVPLPDITISKKLADPATGTALVSDTITFTIRFTNSGQTDITSLVVTDTYAPIYLTLTSWSLMPDAHDPAQGVITWTNGLAGFLPLLPGQAFTLTVDFHALAATTPGVTTNTAFVLGEDQYVQPVGPESGHDDVEIEPVAAVGDLVWWDVDDDGRQDPGEPGIPGVDVVLSDGMVLTTTTDASGLYTFTTVPPDTYTIRIPDYEFQPGGTLENWLASPQDAAPDDVDSDGHQVTHDVVVMLAGGDVITTTDFGFDIPSSYTITKRLNTVGPVRMERPLSFTIRITNTGWTTIFVLPLQDVYSTTYLTYGYTDTTVFPHVSTWADPDSDDHHDDGVIDWSDLTASEGDLAPNGSVTVIVTFTAKADTHHVGLPNDETEDTATAHDVRADPDGPGGPLLEETLPAESATDGVGIEFPTGVVLVSLNGVARPDGVLVTWQTASELEVLGFNLLRAEAGSEWVLLNEVLIFAECAGAEWGADYGYRDGAVALGTTYYYLLEIVKSDGSVERYDVPAVTARWWVNLPLMAR